MITIGWSILLLFLIIGLRLGRISVGLLSGLALGLLTFWIQPTVPPHDLILLQATWLLLMATVETTGFFYVLQNSLRAFLANLNPHYRFWIPLFCYILVFLTGDKKWVYGSLCDQNSAQKSQARLILSVGIALHMGLLVSPLSISGLFLIIVARNSGLSILALVGIIGSITIGITLVTSLLLTFISEQWLLAKFSLSNWLNTCSSEDEQVLPIAKHKVGLIFLLLLLTQLLFLLVNPQSNGLTECSCIQKVFAVRFPMFFALVMLSIGGLVMLSSKIKPPKILQTCRFKLGIQQFFIFLGLTWLLDTLISHDKAFLTEMLAHINANYVFVFLASVYLILIDLPIVIWLFSPLLIAHHSTILTLSVLFVLIHSLAPISYWLSKILEPYKRIDN